MTATLALALGLAVVLGRVLRGVLTAVLALVPTLALGAAVRAGGCALWAGRAKESANKALLKDKERGRRECTETSGEWGWVPSCDRGRLGAVWGLAIRSAAPHLI